MKNKLKIKQSTYFLYSVIIFILCCNTAFSQISFDGFKISSFFITKDASRMLLVSDHTGKSQMYESFFEYGKWTPPVSVDSINNHSSVESYLSAPYYSYDKKYIYFSATFPEGKGGKDIYYIVKDEEGVWSDPINLGLKINSSIDEDDPSVSPDNMSIYFSRLNTESPVSRVECKELFSSNRDVNYNWEKAKRMPLEISTGCDCNVKILSDNKTLLFSRFDKSTKWDLAYIRKMKGKNWFLPEPITTPDMQYSHLYPCFVEAENKVYYLEDSRSPVIKSVVPPVQAKPLNTFTIKGKILDKYTNKPIKSKVDVYDPKTSKIVASTSSDIATGYYQIILPQGKEYSLRFFSKGYSSAIKNFISEVKNQTEEVDFDAFLFDKVSLFVNIFDKDIFEPLDGLVEVITSSGINISNENIEKVAPGRFKLNLAIHENYTIKTTLVNYESQTIQFDLNGVILFNEFEKDIELNAEKIPLSFSLNEELSGDDVNCSLILIDKKTGEKIEVSKPKNGKFLVEIKKGSEYDVVVNSPQGYLFYSDKINTADFANNEELEKNIDIQLQKISQDVSIELKDINFQSNSADLDESSYKELDRVVKLLTDNSTVNIEIAAHTDDIGSDDYNIRLSRLRARSVVEYIVLNNIDPERLLAVGYGESKPLFPNENDENRAKNRRVELKIVKVDE